MDISIVILNYKMRGLVKNCLKAIFESQVSVSYEVIVVDNNSNDGVEQLIKEQFPQVIFIQTGRNDGMGAGNNAGIKVAQGNYILIMNPDIFVYPGSIQKMYDYIKDRADVGLVAPRLLNADGTLQYSCYRWYGYLTPLFRRTFLGNLKFAKRDVDKFLMLDWDHASNREVDWIQGSCWFVPKKVFDIVGLFDESFFMYFEDTDLCRRIHNEKYKIVYLAQAEVLHLHRRQSADNNLWGVITNKLTRTHIKSWFKYLWKWRKRK